MRYLADAIKALLHRYASGMHREANKETPAIIAAVVMGVALVILLMLLAVQQTGHISPRAVVLAREESSSVSPPVPFSSEDANLPLSWRRQKDINDVMFPITLPAKFFVYPWGEYGVSTAQANITSGLIVSDTLVWYAVVVPQAVYLCDNVILVAPRASPRRLYVHPDMPTIVRKINLAPGRTIGWGCVVHGQVFWASITMDYDWACLRTHGNIVAGIRHLSRDANTTHLVLSSDCWKLDGAQIVHVHGEGKTPLFLQGKFQMLEDAICAFSASSEQACVDWNGNPIETVPGLPHQEIEIY